MRPEDVNPEWVEKAAAVLRDSGLINVCGDDRGCQCEDAVEYSQAAAHDMLAAVLPLAQAAALNEAAVEVLALGSISGSRVEVGRRAASWLGSRAARLREGGPS